MIDGLDAVANMTSPRILQPVVLVCLLLACAAGLVLTGCGKDQAAAKAGKSGNDRPVAVTTTIVQPRAFNDVLQALGTAQARESVTITAKVSDVVTRLAFDSGQRVRAGQLLADMNSRAQQADVTAAEAALRDAEQQQRRGGELAKAQLIARGQYDTLRANRDAAAASVQAKRASVADRTITAPFAGVLGLRQVSIGALVSPGTVITTLDDDSTIKLDFTVPEAALSSLAAGQSITATSAGAPPCGSTRHQCMDGAAPARARVRISTCPGTLHRLSGVVRRRDGAGVAADLRAVQAGAARTCPE
jgi:membrane fusion protein (multidrug efflux system)